jgi:hypothetical protein
MRTAGIRLRVCLGQEVSLRGAQSFRDQMEEFMAKPKQDDNSRTTKEDSAKGEEPSPDNDAGVAGNGSLRYATKALEDSHGNNGSDESHAEDNNDFDKGYLERFQGWSFTRKMSQRIKEELQRDREWVSRSRQ